ncbi:MAG TPA: hypothetical protein VKM56_02625 [Verrucomicrobiae bacterium]|jgi:hypothetical protein|nr:hypothetical protein [Verrucomicrobiae bacterium]
MTILRIVLGFVLAAFFILSGFLHSILGWRRLSGQLRAAHAPEELIGNLALGWHFGGAAMLAFGSLLIFLCAKFLQDRGTSLRIAQLIAIFYIGFGMWAQVASHNVFFLVMFIVPGLLLLFAASAGPSKAV